MTSAAVTGRAFAYGFSLLVCEWVEVEIVGVPYISPIGHPVVEVWVPSVDGPHAYTIASLSNLSRPTRFARQLLEQRQ